MFLRGLKQWFKTACSGKAGQGSKRVVARAYLRSTEGSSGRVPETDSPQPRRVAVVESGSSDLRMVVEK